MVTAIATDEFGNRLAYTTEGRAVILPGEAQALNDYKLAKVECMNRDVAEWVKKSNALGEMLGIQTKLIYNIVSGCVSIQEGDEDEGKEICISIRKGIVGIEQIAWGKDETSTEFIINIAENGIKIKRDALALFNIKSMNFEAISEIENQAFHG